MTNIGDEKWAAGAAGRRSFLAGAAAVGGIAATGVRARTRPKPIEVLAYYFPAWHRDARQAEWHGKDWTEWRLLAAARPRYPGHQQPKIPAWGEFDESDPAWATREIALAADHGLTGFIYDWYWYDGKPFLQAGLEDGFLKAPNTSRMKFALMWANHDWLNIFPSEPGKERPLLTHGGVDRAEFERLTDYIVAHYLNKPNYVRVDGGLYFSVYELGTLIKGLGGVNAAKSALDSFRAKVVHAGLGQIHLNAVVWGVQVLPSENKLLDPAAVVRELGLSSLTTYAWVHNYPVGDRSFPQDSYVAAAEASYAAWDRYAALYGLPYHPNVSMGWDPSPRTRQDVPYRSYGYPWQAVLEGNTPNAYEAALLRAKRWVEARPPEQRVVTLNAWNEWTEGSYLLPDNRSGMAYLSAVKRVFG